MENDKNDFNVMSDIEELQKALKDGQITTIVELICKRTNAQRQKIKETYYNSYNVELIKEFESKLSGKIKELILGLMMTPEDFDANEMYLAMKGLGTDELILSEIISTRPSRHLLQVKERYPIMFKQTLEKDIKGDTSKCYQKILVEIIQGKRSDNPYPNSQKMKEIVEQLNGCEKGKIAEDPLVQNFASCSYGEICTICRLYEKTYNSSILDDIKNSVDDDAYNFFEMFLEYISDSGSFFAEKLHSFKDKDLNRIFVSRSEVNMDEIRDAYKELYKNALVENNTEKQKVIINSD